MNCNVENLKKRYCYFATDTEIVGQSWDPYEILFYVPNAANNPLLLFHLTLGMKVFGVTGRRFRIVNKSIRARQIGHYDPQIKIEINKIIMEK